MQISYVFRNWQLAFPFALPGSGVTECIGIGHTKQQAKQDAAEKALRLLDDAGVLSMTEREIARLLVREYF